MQPYSAPTNPLANGIGTGKEHPKEWCRELIEHSDNLLCIHDLQGRLLFVNPAAARLLGYAVPELLLISLRDLVVPEFRPAFDAYLRRIDQVGEDSGFLALNTRSKQRRIWQYHNTLHRTAEPIVYGMAFDVTEQKRLERSLRSSECRFRSIFEKSPSGIYLVDTRSGRFLRTNPRFCEIVGRTEEQLRGVSVADITHPEDVAKGSELMSRLAADELEHFEMEKRYLRPDGSTRWGYLSVSKILGEGETGICNLATVMDITEHKQAEAALRASESHFRMLIEQASDGIFLADSRGRYIDVNTAGAAMLGYTRGEVLQLGITDIVVPEQVPRAQAEIASLLSGSTARNEWQFRRKDGSVFPGEVTSRSLPDGRLQGILRDLTERRLAEEALRDNEKRLAGLVASAMDAIISVNEEHRIVLFNLAAEEVFGCSASEAVGQSIERFIPQQFRAAHEGHLRNFAHTGVTSRSMGALGELGALRADGQEFPIEASISQVEVAGRKAFTVILRDITHRKRMEDELRRANEKLAEEKIYLEHEIGSLFEGELIGQNQGLKKVLEEVAKVAPSNATVLLLGETGTGKELMARAVHRLSTRQSKTFIKTNCAAIPSGLLESELFGHEKGAFTGAISRKFGRLELADKGTLFLDEIGEIPLDLQPKLLRVLQDQEFERLGSTQTLKVDFRLIAATNRDLAKSVADKQFRSDLYYRINIFPIRIPPLRERRKDIPLLVEHFVKKFAAKMNKSITSIPVKTMELLMQRNWPGNVRELENLVERSVILTRGATLEFAAHELLDSATPSPVPGTLVEVQRQQILQVLREAGGQLTQAAARLGLPRTTLQSKLKNLGIDPRQFRA